MQKSVLLLAGIVSLARASPAQANNARQESVTSVQSATRTLLPLYDSTGTATTIGPCEWNLRIGLLGTQPTLAPEAAKWFGSSIGTRSEPAPITHTSQIGPSCTSIIEYKNTFTAPPAVKSAYSSWLEEHSSWVDDRKDVASSVLAGCTSAQFAQLSFSVLEALATDVAGCERHLSDRLLYTPPPTSSRTGQATAATSTSTRQPGACEKTIQVIRESLPTQAPELSVWYEASFRARLSQIRTQSTKSVESITRIDQISSMCSSQHSEASKFEATYTTPPAITTQLASWSSALSAWRDDNESLIRSVVYTLCAPDQRTQRANAFNLIATDVPGCVENFRLMGIAPFLATETTTGQPQPTGTAGVTGTVATGSSTSPVTAGAARETGYVVAVVAVVAAVAAL